MEPCGGCRYEEYPYKAQLPIFIDGKRPLWEFKSDRDIWKAVDLLIEELYENNKKGKEFDMAQSINAQLPFFTCKNVVHDKEIQRDIQRYVYCRDTNVPPYNGAYNEQPALWVERYFVIKSAFAKMEKTQIDKVRKDGTRKN